MANDPEAAAELRALGLKAVPVTVAGGRAVVGFDVPALKEALGIRGEVAGDLSAEEMLEKYRVVFEGAKRAVLQVPEEKLDWVSPERERTLRQLTWHLFERPDLCMQAARTGRYTYEMVRQYERLANDYRTSRDIVAYADMILARLEDFLTGQTHLLEKEVETYFGPSTVRHILDMALGHAAFHLKHTYHYLRVLGVEPERPLGEEELAGIGVPRELF